MTRLDVQMVAELEAAAEAVKRQEQLLPGSLAPLAARLRRKPPQVVVTCGRGSSAHAASFGKHLIERHLGIPVAAAAPVIASVYRQRLRLQDQLFLVISQSGTSGDLIEQAAAARASGAITACITNDTHSELAEQCEFILPMAAGPELSVPATKTFIASLSALARLTASWAADEALSSALERLPDRLANACKLDWRNLVERIRDAESLATIGRGPTLAIAREAALKLKETSNLQAEAFSAAEFLHGPVSLVSPGYPILAFMPGDAAAASVRQLAAGLRTKGAIVFTAGWDDGTQDRLAALPADHPETDPICLIQSFYVMAVALSAARGMDAGRPPHLQKITRTR
jgi:glucosamine--fructose-6-phosphate aminotransferase (isomerizing)